MPLLQVSFVKIVNGGLIVNGAYRWKRSSLIRYQFRWMFDCGVYLFTFYTHKSTFCENRNGITCVLCETISICCICENLLSLCYNFDIAAAVVLLSVQCFSFPGRTTGAHRNFKLTNFWSQERLVKILCWRTNSNGLAKLMEFHCASHVICVTLD